MNITLIGYRGTGKSTVAQLVASRLGWSWVDVDACIEQSANQTIREIFATEGEAGFRERESSLLLEMAQRNQLVIATGGGAVIRPENRRVIRQCGLTAWLVASPAAIQQRISADPTSVTRRPPLTHRSEFDEICQLLAVREPLYRECADLIVDTERRSPDEIALQVVQAVTARIRSTPTE